MCVDFLFFGMFEFYFSEKFKLKIEIRKNVNIIFICKLEFCFLR